MSSGESNLIDITGEIRARTDRAVLLFDGMREVWLPLSQIEIDGDRPGVVEVAMPEWLALEKGLI